MYNKNRFRKKLFVIILVPVVIILIGLAVAFASAEISFGDVYKAVFRRLLPALVGSDDTGHADIIIWKLRLPRILMGLPAGLAISSAAGFGASRTIILGVGVFAGPYLIIGNAFLFSLISSGLILALSGRRAASPELMFLMGKVFCR